VTDQSDLFLSMVLPLEIVVGGMCIALYVCHCGFLGAMLAPVVTDWSSMVPYGYGKLTWQRLGPKLGRVAITHGCGNVNYGATMYDRCREWMSFSRKSKAPLSV
jgi:hypothetical protein